MGGGSESVGPFVCVSARARKARECAFVHVLGLCVNGTCVSR